MSLLRRSRLRLCAAVVVVSVLVPAAGAAACSSARPSAGAAYAGSVRCLLNEQRGARGLAPLRADGRLAAAARRFSVAMVRGRFFSHVGPDGSTMSGRIHATGYRAPLLGETIAWGAGTLASPAAIVRGWMASPPHRAIILDGRFREVGIGVAVGSPAGYAHAATVTADYGR